MAEPVSLQTVLTYLTLISIPVGVIYHILTLNNTRKNQEMQLETRQAQLFMQMYNRFQDSVRGLDWSEIIFTKLSGLDEFFEKSKSDENFRLVTQAFFAFYEGLGVLVKEGYLSLRLIVLMWAGSTRKFYENIVLPIIEEGKVYWDYPRLWSETVYVCKEVLKYMEEHPELRT